MSNTIMYQGEINDLPRCQKCEKNIGEEHELMTYDHPYKMGKSKKK